MYYDFSALDPLSIHIDEAGDTHIVYVLPSPIKWPFEVLRDPGGYREELHLVKQVRVCVTTSAFPACAPHTVIIPYYSDGQECPLNSLAVAGVASVVKAMLLIGFIPVLCRQ
ncbi:hypothetical protein GCM10027085_63620 [Spirosoma aerophilum]